MNTNPYKCGRCGSEQFLVATRIKPPRTRSANHVRIGCLGLGCFQIIYARTMEAAWAAITKQEEKKEEP